MTTEDLAELDEMEASGETPVLFEILISRHARDLIDLAKDRDRIAAMYLESTKLAEDAMTRIAAQRDAFERIARTLASLHVRGNGYCSACASVNYHDVSGRTPELIHNNGCPVTELETLAK